MSRGWRIGIAVVAVLVAVNVLFRLLGSLTGGTPGGPRSSSYATSKDGAAAFAELLGHVGHPVDQVRAAPHAASLEPGSTVFLLDAYAVAPRDTAALRSWVEAGGTLVVAGVPRASLRLLLPRPPALVQGRALVRVSGPGGERLIRTATAAAWRSANGSRTFLETRTLGRGTVYALADASPLQNRLLGSAGNAAFGLALAGPSSRPVAFLETYHGYGRAAGLAALPRSWKFLLAGLGLAALVWLVARGRRFGPPEPEGRTLPPPRRAYVDALAAVIMRSRQRDAAVEPVRAEARRLLLRRFALPPDTPEEGVQAAARRLGLPAAEVEALLVPARTDADVLAVGRALVEIGEDRH